MMHAAKMRPEALEGLVRSAKKKAKRTFSAPVEFNQGFHRSPTRWGEPKRDLFEWFCFVDCIDKFTDLVGLNWGAETFLEWHNSRGA